MLRKFIFLLAVGASGCATTEEMKERTVEYAFSPDFDLKEIRTLAVIPSVAADTTDSLTNLLLREIRGKTYSLLIGELMKVPSFDIVERKDIDRIIEELEFSHSPYSMRQNAPRLGKLLGADLVAYFSVISVERVVYPFGESEIGWTYRLTGSLKIVDVETGRLLYQATAVAEGTDAVEVLKGVIKRTVYPLSKRLSP